MNPEDNIDFIATEISSINQVIRSLDFHDIEECEEPAFPLDFDINSLDGFTEDPDLE